eukprot:gene12237-14338_t
MSASQKKEDIENLKEEFSRRIGQLEKKIKDISKERDALKSGSSVSESVTNSLKEKDEQINQLMQEGTALSHKVLALESSVKKYRHANKEHEETLQLLNDRITTTDNLLATKTERLRELEDTDRKYHDTIVTMKEVTEITTKRAEERESVAERASKQASELQTALEKAWKDISDLNKHHAIEADRYERTINETRQKTRDEMNLSLTGERAEWKKREDSLERGIHEQKAAIQRANERLLWKEEELTKEIQHLNQRCREAEMRNDQLSSSIPDTTRPLIKQIEALQASNESRQATWEALERSLIQQIKESKVNAESAIQNEQEAMNELEEITHKFNSLESELKKERATVKNLNNDLSNERVKVKDLSQQIKEMNVQIEQLKSDKATAEKTIAKYEEKLEKAYKDYRDAEEVRQREKEAERERREEEKKSSLTSSYDTPTKMYGIRKNSSQLDFLQLLADSKELSKLRTDVKEMQTRYSTALEMLGEKEEAVNELRMDIVDMKELYRSQINELLSQMEKKPSK